jgi:hypothetical protein
MPCAVELEPKNLELEPAQYRVNVNTFNMRLNGGTLGNLANKYGSTVDLPIAN